MLITKTFWILVIVAALFCAIGFYRFIWFLSVGYGLAVAGCGAALAIVSLVRGNISAALLIQCLLMVVYGCRLGLFLLIREMKNAAYKKALDSQTKPVPVFVKIVMWICLAFLYPCQVSGVMYRLDNGVTPMGGDALQWIGILVMLCGILLEAEADREKSEQKKLRPGMAAMEGLYKFCRCPNYFGEVLFWTGIVISAIPAVKGLQWIIVLIGYICIVCIMVSGANRLDKRQKKNYGEDPEFIAYSAKTKKLIPYIW